MKFNIYKVTTIGLATLVVATIFANPFKGSVAPRSFDLAEDSSIPAQRAPASLNEPVVARQFYPAPPQHPFEGGSSFQNASVSNLHYEEPQQIPDYSPPSSGMNSIAFPQANSAPSSYRASSPSYSNNNDSGPAKTETKKSDDTKTKSTDDSSPSNSAVGSYGGLPTATASPSNTYDNSSASGNTIPAASAPTAVNAVGEPGAVALTWAAASGDGTITYSVERSLTATSGFAALAYGLSGTSYTDTTAINGILYYYRVRSLNSTGGSYSDVISAFASDLPTTPTLTLVASNGTASLAWNTSTGVGPITYSVERSISPGTGYGVVTGGLTTPVFSDSAATNGNLFYYRVQAHNAAGVSGYSPEIAAKSIASFMMGTAVAGIESAAVTWNSATGATQYDVKYGVATGIYTTTLANKTSSFTVPTLTANTPYFFSITASNAYNGLTVSTNELSAKPLGAFTITSLTPTDIGKLRIIWASSSGATSYDIGCSTTTGVYTTVTLTNQTSPTTITGLSNATSYYCMVTAKNATGAGNATAEATATTFSLLTYLWPFDAGTDTAYSFDASKLELVGGVSRLKNATPTDASFVGNDFKDALFSGVKWDAANSKVTLDSASDDGELNSQWTPQYNKIVGYWKLNGSAIGPIGPISQGDIVAATMGASGVAQNSNATGMSYAGGKLNRGITFDGVDDRITINSFSLPSVKYTKSAWISIQDYTADNNIFSQGGSHFFYTPGGYLTAGHTGTATVAADPVKLPINTWVHVTVTYDSTVGSGTMRLYKNGVQVASQTGIAGFSDPTANIGSFGTGNLMKGSIDEVAVWSTALSDLEIRKIYERQNARYTGTILSRVMSSGQTTSWAGLNYLTNLPYGKELSTSSLETAATYRGLDALTNGQAAAWALDEASGSSVSDSSISSYSGTTTNVTLGSAGHFGKSALFAGNGRINFGDVLNPGSTSYTVSSWFKRSSSTIPASSETIASKGNSNSADIGWSVKISSAGAQLVIRMNSDGNTQKAGMATPLGITDTNWHQVVMVIDRENNLLTGYLDGSASAFAAGGGGATSNTMAGYTAVTTTEPIVIGANARAGSYLTPFNGNVDDTRIWNRALSAAEVTRLYSMAQPIDPPIAKNLVGLWHLNETSGTTATDSSTSGRTGTYHGSLTLGAPGKLGTAVKFNGDITQSMTASDAGLPSGIQPRTVSMWAYTGVVDDITLPVPSIHEAFQYGNYASGNMTALAINNNNWYFSQHGGALLGGPVIPNQWQHIVATFDGSIWSIFMDGVFANSASMGTNTILGAGVTLGQGGGGASYAFNGSIDEVGIWSRVLSAAEIKQLYQRGANRVLMQARTCSSADCSDDPTGANWRGSSSSSTSFLSELNNTTANSPQFLFTNFGYSLTNQPFFQYRAILESDSSSALPDLVSVSAGPARYDGSSPSIIPIDGPKFQIYTGLTTTLGSSCTGVPKLQLSHDKITWYYYATGMWNVATAGVTQASDSSTINTNMGTFTNVAGVGELYAKIFYPSNTSTECEINSISVAGADSSSTNSTNPGAFAITSVSPSNGAVAISWNAATGATSYKLCYGTTQAIANSCLNYVTLAGTSTTVSALTNDTPYYFNLQAVNASGITFSNLPAYIAPMAAPSVPTTLAATNGLEVNNLTWTNSTGSGVVTYNIKRGTASGSYTTIATGVTTNAYSDISATPGIPYFYVVSATNAGGSSGNSNEVTSTAMSIVRYSWNFDYGTDSSYTFDASKVELSSTGLGRLANRTPTDSSYVGNDFKTALFSGVKWDAANSKVTLDSATDDGEMNSQWTPKYNQISHYYKMNGTANSNLITGQIIRGTVGPDAVFQNPDQSVAPVTTFKGGVQNQGLHFDGVDDVIYEKNDSLLNRADGNPLALSIWIKPHWTSGYITIMANRSAAGSFNWILYQHTNSGHLSLHGNAQYESTYTPPNDVWTHVAVSVSSGGISKIYANGVEVYSGAYQYQTGLPGSLGIGAWLGTNEGYYAGDMDEAAIWTSSLSAAEVKTIYERQRSRFTGTILSRVMSSGAATSWAGLSYLTNLPYGKELLANQTGDSVAQYPKSNYLSPSGLKAYWPLDEAGPAYSDSTGNSAAGNAIGTYTSVTGKLNRGIHFDGTSSISLGNPSQLPAGSASRTACFWANADSLVTDNTFRFAFGYGTATTGNAFTIGLQNNHFIVSNWGAQINFSAAVTANTWNHVCATSDGSQLKLYFNGALDTTSTLAINTPLNIATIGRQLNGNQWWIGSIDEVGVWDRVLPLSEIQQMYQMNSSLMAGNVGLWHFNNTWNDSSGNGNNGTATGATFSSSGAFTSSGLFTAATDSVNAGSGTSLANTFSNGGTISAWINPLSMGGGVAGRIFDKTQTLFFVQDHSGPKLVFYRIFSTGFGQWETPIAMNAWQHVVVVYDERSITNTPTLYIDGVSQPVTVRTAPTAGPATSDAGTTLYIGNNAANTRNFDGMIDELAVWKRALTDLEVKQIYLRKANQVLFQARSCANADCSDDPTDSNWRGSSSSPNSYLSEINNATSSSPQFLFSNFGYTLANQPFFQYRAILTSDTASFSPELTSVSAGPARFDGSTPVIIPVNGAKFQTLSSFNAILGAAGCSGTPKFQLSPDKNNWYYYSGGWISAGVTADISKANDTSTINAYIPGFTSVLGTGNLYVRAYLPSNTSTACEIDSITVQGGHTNPSNSTNPNAFQITSVTGESGQAVVTWAAATGATSYTVCYGTTQAQADACAQTYSAGAATSATIGSLTNNTQYYFSVIANNGSGRSPASVPVSGMPVPLPSTPTSLLATSSAMSINLTWSSVAEATSYTIMRGTSAGSLTPYASGITSNAITDLMAGSNTTYYYSVRSVNASGSSTDSNVDSATGIGSFTVSLDTPPNAYNGKIVLKWTAALGATSYKVKYGTSSGLNTIDLGTQTSPLTISGLTNETTYYILVTAYNAKGKANAQNELNATPWLYPNISINNTTLNQGNVAQYTIALDQASLHPIIFQAATSNGSAASGTDYVARTKTVTIPAGQTSSTFTVNTSAATTFTGATRNFSTTLSSIQNAILSGSGIGIATLIDPVFSMDLTSETLDSRVKFSRASAGTYFDSTGIMQISGANLVRYSEDLSNAVWTKGDNSTGIFPTVTANAATAPDGSNSASFVGVPAGVGGYVSQNVPVTSGKVYSASVWVKGSAGEHGSMGLKPCSNLGIAYTGAGFTFTGNWQLIKMENFTVTEACLFFSAADGVNQNNIPSGQYVWGANVNEGNHIIGYTKTLNAPSYLPRIDHDPASGISKGLLIESQSTNLLPYSDQFDQASSWVVAAKAIGSGSVANSMATTDPMGTNNAEFIQEGTGTQEPGISAVGSLPAPVVGNYYTFLFT